MAGQGRPGPAPKAPVETVEVVAPVPAVSTTNGEVATPVKKQRDIPEDAEIIRWKTGPEQWGFAIRYGTKWRVFDSGYVAAESTLVEKTKWTGLGPSTIEVLR